MVEAQVQDTEIPNHKHRAGSYITFSSIDARYVLSVKFVRYITTPGALKCRLAPAKEGENRTVFDFGGDALVLHNFGEIVHNTSHSSEIADLIELLAARREDHIRWITALEHSIVTGEPFTKAVDPHECAFGRWYDRYVPRDADFKSILEQFDSPHKRIHALAGELLAMAVGEEGRNRAVKQLDAERRGTLRLLLNLFDEAVHRLEDLNKPVVLVLHDGNKTFGLQVESIGDMMEFEEVAWLPDPNADKNCCYDGFFQTEKGDLFLNVVPHQLLHHLDAKMSN